MPIFSNWLIMKEHTDRWLAKTFGCGATALMAAASVTRFPCRRLMRLRVSVACEHCLLEVVVAPRRPAGRGALFRWLFGGRLSLNPSSGVVW